MAGSLDLVFSQFWMLFPCLQHFLIFICGKNTLFFFKVCCPCRLLCEQSVLARHFVPLTHSALGSGPLHMVFPKRLYMHRRKTPPVVPTADRTPCLTEADKQCLMSSLVLKGTDFGDRLSIGVVCHPPPTLCNL